MRALAFILLLAAGSVQAAEPTTVGVITNPDWAIRPNPADLSSAYPSIAAWMMIEGRAVMECDTDELGRLRRCRLLEESPPGLGFGPATLSVASRFQMNPRRVDGRPIAGGQVRVPLRWSLPPASPPNHATSKVVELDAAKLAVARRIAIAQDWTGQAKASVQDGYEYFRAMSSNLYASDPNVEREALAAHAEAIEALGSQRVDLVARFLAQRLTEQQLQAAVTYYESASGRAMSKLVWTNLQTTEEDDALWEHLGDAVRAEARKRFCAKRDCEVRSAAAAP